MAKLWKISPSDFQNFFTYSCCHNRAHAYIAESHTEEFFFIKICLNSRHAGETLTGHAASRRSTRCARNTRSYMCGQFHRACVCRSILVSRQRKKDGEKKRGRKKKKRCWVHDSCKPRGHTSPRLAPPLMTLVAPFLPLCHSTPASVCLFSPL